MVIVDPDYVGRLTELENRYWEFRNSTDPGLEGAYRPASPFCKYRALVCQDDIVTIPAIVTISSTQTSWIYFERELFMMM